MSSDKRGRLLPYADPWHATTPDTTDGRMSEAEPWKRGDKAVLEVEVWKADDNGFGAWVIFDGLDGDRKERQTFWYPQSSLVRPASALTTTQARVTELERVRDAAAQLRDCCGPAGEAWCMRPDAENVTDSDCGNYEWRETCAYHPIFAALATEEAGRHE